MSKKREIDLLSGEMCISLVNEPLDFEVEPLTALERARRIWVWGDARVIEGEKGEPNK